MRARKIATALAALGAAFLLAGCALLFGHAETDGQRLYQKAGEYVYVSIPVEIYVKRRDAEGGVVAAVCTAEADVYAALQDSFDSFAADGQRLPMGFLAIGKTLSVFAIDVFGAVGIPDDPGEAIGATRIMIAVGAAAIPPMRDYRRGELKPALAAMAADGRDPSPDEWAAIRATVDSQHAGIAAACGT